MTTSRYLYSALDINMSVLRFWGDKPTSLLDILHFDTPVGWYVFEGLHTDALSPGFDIVDIDGEILPEFEAIDPHELEDLVDKYAKARAEGNKQFCVLGMFDFEDGGGDRLYWITDKDIIDMDIVPGTKKLSKFKFASPIEYSKQYNLAQPIVVDDMDSIRLIGEYDRRIGRFRSRYESIIDNLVGLSILDQQLTLLVIRVGSGVRRIEVVESLLNDPEARDKLEDMLENWGMNTLLIVPVTSLSEDGFRAELDFGDGSPPINWPESRSNLLRGITIRLGVPEEVFNGAEIGLRSSEKNHGKYLNTLYAEQRRMSADLMWCISKQFGIKFPEGAYISWKPFVEPDEETMIKMFADKMEALDKAMRVADRAGIPLDYLKDQLKLDYDTDEQLIQKYEQKQELNQEALNARVSESSTSNTNGQPTDNQPGMQTAEQA